MTAAEVETAEQQGHAESLLQAFFASVPRALQNALPMCMAGDRTVLRSFAAPSARRLPESVAQASYFHCFLQFACNPADVGAAETFMTAKMEAQRFIQWQGALCWSAHQPSKQIYRPCLLITSASTAALCRRPTAACVYAPHIVSDLACMHMPLSALHNNCTSRPSRTVSNSKPGRLDGFQRSRSRGLHHHASDAIGAHAAEHGGQL